MVTCQKCGKPVFLTDTYCRYCGYPQDQQRNNMVFEKETAQRMEPCVEKYIFKYKKENYFLLLWETGKQPSLNFRHLSAYGQKMLLLELELDRFKTELLYAPLSSVDRKKRSIEIREEKIEKLIATLQDIAGDIHRKPKSGEALRDAPELKVTETDCGGKKYYAQSKEGVTSCQIKRPTLFMCTCGVFAALIIGGLSTALPPHKSVGVHESERDKYAVNAAVCSKENAFYQEEVVSALIPLPTKQKQLSLTGEIEWELRNTLPSRWKVVSVTDIDGVRIHICVQDSENDQFSPIWKKETPHGTVSKTCANIAFLCATKRGGGYWISVAVKDSTGMSWESYRWREHSYKNGSVTTDGWLTDFH